MLGTGFPLRLTGYLWHCHIRLIHLRLRFLCVSMLSLMLGYNSLRSWCWPQVLHHMLCSGWNAIKGINLSFKTGETKAINLCSLFSSSEPMFLYLLSLFYLSHSLKNSFKNILKYLPCCRWVAEQSWQYCLYCPQHVSLSDTEWGHLVVIIQTLL